MEKKTTHTLMKIILRTSSEQCAVASSHMIMKVRRTNCEAGKANHSEKNGSESG